MSLKNLHRYISDKLQPAKWPQLIVFMDDVVKTHTNKVQRIGLANRMVLVVSVITLYLLRIIQDLKEISDSTPEMERLLEAVCPPKGSSLKEPIPVHTVDINSDHLSAYILKFSKVKHCAVRFFKKKLVAYVIPSTEAEIQSIFLPNLFNL